MSAQIAATHNDAVRNKNAVEIIQYVTDLFDKKIIFASSMGIEDQVITDMLNGLNSSIGIFTLDTGRLFPETYNLICSTEEHYSTRINVFFPDTCHVEEMIKEEGINLFYHSVENRKRCCRIRKTEPLQRALKDYPAWICGLRRDQSVTRTEVNAIEWDNKNNLYKINPLYNWSDEQVWTYARKHHVPYNPLHDKGFASIGCQPCTRAVKPGEDIRSGRWWWEDPDKKECGLHS